MHIMIRHKVQDYATWKTAFDNFASFRRTSGEQSYRILHPSDDSNDLTLIFEWDSQGHAETFLASPELKDAMQQAGVAEEPKIQFMNEPAQGAL
jgi:quinol monooxygenase YgiN